MDSAETNVMVENSNEKLATLSTDAKVQSKTISVADFAETDVIRVQTLFRGRRARQMVSSWARVVNEMQRMFHLRDKNVRARNMLALVKATDEKMQDDKLRKYYHSVQNTVCQTLTGLTHDKRVILEKQHDQEVHYTLQGNREHYSAHSMYKRQLLLRSEELRAISLVFWKVTKAARFRNYEQSPQDDTSAALRDDTLTYAEYRQLFLRISKVLVPDFNDLQCEVTIREDWHHEHRTQMVVHPQTGAQEEAICQEQLHHSLFELVDHWLDVIDLAAYKTFMLQLLWTVCQSISEPEASAATDSQRGWRGIELRELGDVSCYLNIVGDLAIPYSSDSVEMVQLLDETANTILTKGEVPELTMREHTSKLIAVDESEADRAARLEMEQLRKLNLSKHELYDELERRQLAKFRAKMHQEELEEQKKKNAQSPAKSAAEPANDVGTTTTNDLADIETPKTSGGASDSDVDGTRVNTNVRTDANASTNPGFNTSDIVNDGDSGGAIGNGIGAGVGTGDGGIGGDNTVDVGASKDTGDVGSAGEVSGGGASGGSGGNTGSVSNAGGISEAGVSAGGTDGGRDNRTNLAGAISTDGSNDGAGADSIEATGDGGPGAINEGASVHGNVDASGDGGISGDTRGIASAISGTPARGGGAGSSANVESDMYDGVAAGAPRLGDTNGTGNKTVGEASSSRLNVRDASVDDGTAAEAQVANSTNINSAGESGRRHEVHDASTPLDTPNAQPNATSMDDPTNDTSTSANGDGGASRATRSPRAAAEVETADEADLRRATSKINPTAYLSHLRQYWRGDEGLAEEAATATATGGSDIGGGEEADTGDGDDDGSGGNGDDSGGGHDGGGVSGAMSMQVDKADANSTPASFISDDVDKGVGDPHPALALAKEMDAEEEAELSKYLVPTQSSKALQRAQASQRSIARNDLDEETDTSGAYAMPNTTPSPSHGPPSRSGRSFSRSAPRSSGGPSSRAARNSGVAAALKHRETVVKAEAESDSEIDAEGEGSLEPLVWIEKNPTEEAGRVYDVVVPSSPITGYAHRDDETGHDGANEDLGVQQDYEYYPPKYVAAMRLCIVSDRDSIIVQ